MQMPARCDTICRNRQPPCRYAERGRTAEVGSVGRRATPTAAANAAQASDAESEAAMRENRTRPATAEFTRYKLFYVVRQAFSTAKYAA